MSFTPGRMIWTVNRETALLLGAGRALLLQIAHPLVAAGVAEHSRFAQQPLDRLWRTLNPMYTLVFGSLEARQAAARGLEAAHRRVRGVLEAQRGSFEALGCIVEEASPDLSGEDKVFLAVRMWRSWSVLGPLLEKHRDLMKPEAVWEIESGARLTGSDISDAMIQHGAIMERVRRFQERYEFMLCAVNQVPPFDATIDWPKEIEAVKMEHYVAWMKSAYWITVTFHPAISVPAGFTSEGLPVGIQIVGRHRDDLGVLQIAHAFEQATGFGRKRPALALS